MRRTAALSISGPSEIQHRAGERFRVLLGDEVRGPGYADPGHVLGYLVHHLLDERPRGTHRAAHREDRHAEFAVVLQRRLVVVSVLAEGPVHLEAGSHRAWTRVRGCVGVEVGV